VQLQREAVHPGELVVEFFGSDGVAVGQVDVDDAEAVGEGFEEARVAIGFVAGERGGDDLNGRAREDGDAVVGLLGDGSGVVAEILEDGIGELGGFELLEEQDVGRVGLQPGGDVVDARSDGVDVPACDYDLAFLAFGLAAAALDLMGLRAGFFFVGDLWTWAWAPRDDRTASRSSMYSCAGSLLSSA
jgi:hypothetical protein